MKKKIVVFSGAGVSQESGISTFRDSNGLWENHRVEDVASPEGWRRNQELVLDFYNKRRRQLKEVEPNQAHILIAELEKFYDVTVITQNVDDLHERAGSTKVIHLHGELRKVRSTKNPNLIYHWEEDICTGDHCEEDSQLRPHIVWFGESLNEEHLNTSRILASEADAMIVVGTSMQVYPASEIPYFASVDCVIYVIDPNVKEIRFHEIDKQVVKVEATATVGMKDVYGKLIPKNDAN
jgi:NAD-dependent deacetylase